MEGDTSHKKLKVNRVENWSLDDRKDLLEAIKIEIKTIEDKKCDRDALRIKREAWANMGKYVYQCNEITALSM